MLRRQVKVRLDSTPLNRQVNEIDVKSNKNVIDMKYNNFTVNNSSVSDGNVVSRYCDNNNNKAHNTINEQNQYSHLQSTKYNNESNSDIKNFTRQFYNKNFAKFSGGGGGGRTGHKKLMNKHQITSLREILQLRGVDVQMNVQV